MKIRDPQDLLLQELREIHSAERQLQRALPRLSRQVQSQSFRQILDTRVEQGQQLIEDIDRVFDSMGANKSRAKSQAMEGLIEEVNELVDQIEQPMLRDAALVGAVQKVTHYCMAAWGTTRAMGEAFGKQEVAKPMQRLLEESRQQDKRLTEIAERELYPAMLKGEGGQPSGQQAGQQSGQQTGQQSGQQSGSGGGRQGGGKR